MNGRYEVRLRPAAQRDLDRLPKSTLQRIRQALDELVIEPRGSQTRKLTASDDLYRRRVGDYRIIYGIDDGARSVTVFRVLHRKDAYRGS